MLLNGDYPENMKKEEVIEPPRENGLDEGEPGDETTGQEVIVIQDTGFSVKILAPGIEPFSLQVRWRKRCWEWA
jgi:protein TIF31